MKTQIRILTPKQILNTVFFVDGVAGEWRLGDNWQKQESELVRRSAWDIIHQNALAKVQLSIYLGRYIN